MSWKLSCSSSFPRNPRGGLIVCPNVPKSTPSTSLLSSTHKSEENKKKNHYNFCWGTNIRALLPLAHSLKKYPHKPHKLFWAHINIPRILLKYSPCYWALTNIPHISPINTLGHLTNTTHYILHIIQLELSIKNTYHITTELGQQSPTKLS